MISEPADIALVSDYSSMNDVQVCADVLPRVSRTFALTIRVLPRELRTSVTVAYLLCRIADVLEDATGENPALRIQGLEDFAQALAHPAADEQILTDVLAPCLELPLHDPDGRRLLLVRERVFAAYMNLRPDHREVVSQWVQAMALGMAVFVEKEYDVLRSHPTESAEQLHEYLRQTEVPFRLQTTEELRSYAYYVAGTVGHLLTELFRLDLEGDHRLQLDEMRALAVPFGLGLQFTNIVQDMAEDRRRGWSYIPEEMAAKHGTSLEELTLPEHRPAALQVVDEMIHEATENLDRAMEFTLLLPRSAPRIRLFCAWPVLFASRTLGKIRGNSAVIDGTSKIKISRRDVRELIGLTSASCLSNSRLEALYNRERNRGSRVSP